MNLDYAVLCNAQSLDQIDVKFNIIKNYPNIFKWYIKKFTPYKKKFLSIGNTNGIEITMPFLNSHMYDDIDFVDNVTKKIINELNNFSIKAVLYENYKMDIGNLYRANGKYLMPFFMKDGMTKLMNFLKKNLGKLEVLIIAEDNFLTTMIVENIFMHVNFISIINRTNYDYSYLSQVLFEESGLNLNVTNESNYSVQNADIVINTSETSLKNDYLFKRGAVYFDLAKNKERIFELARKRNDILIIDDFGIRMEKEKFKLDYFELGFYSYSKEYRNLVDNMYKSFYIKRVKEQLLKQNIKFSSFYSLGNNLNNQILNSFIKIGGL